MTIVNILGIYQTDFRRPHTPIFTGAMFYGGKNCNKVRSRTSLKLRKSVMRCGKIRQQERCSSVKMSKIAIKSGFLITSVTNFDILYLNLCVFMSIMKSAQQPMNEQLFSKCELQEIKGNKRVACVS